MLFLPHFYLSLNIPVYKLKSKLSSSIASWVIQENNINLALAMVPNQPKIICRIFYVMLKAAHYTGQSSYSDTERNCGLISHIDRGD